jgi:hypothetical protein
LLKLIFLYHLPDKKDWIQSPSAVVSNQQGYTSLVVLGDDLGAAATLAVTIILTNGAITQTLQSLLLAIILHLWYWLLIQRLFDRLL